MGGRVSEYLRAGGGTVSVSLSLSTNRHTRYKVRDALELLKSARSFFVQRLEYAK